MTQQSEQRIAHFTFLPGIPHQRRNSPKTLISTMSLLSIRRCLRDAVQCDDAAEKEKRLIRRYKAFAFCCRKRNFVVNAISDQTLCSATLRRLLIIKIVNKFIISRRRGQCCTHYHQQISSVAAVMETRGPFLRVPVTGVWPWDLNKMSFTTKDGRKN